MGKNEKVDQSRKTKVQPINNIKPGSEQHRKLRDTRLKYGAGSKEYREVALNVQAKQSTELKETENKNTEPVSPRVKSKPKSKVKPVSPRVKSKSPAGGGRSSQSNRGKKQSRGGRGGRRGGKSR